MKLKKWKRVYCMMLLTLLILTAGSVNPVEAASYNGVEYSVDWHTWKQVASAWGSRKLGDLCTMSNSGCLITSIAILMAKSGAEDPNSFNPGVLRDRYESKGFVSHNSSSVAADGNLSYAAYSKSNSPNFYSVGSSNYHPTPYNQIYDDLNTHLSRGEYAVVNVNYGGHFVAVDYCSNGTVYIVDPAGSAKTTLKQYDGGIENATFFAAVKQTPQPVSSASSITISGANAPGTLNEGNVFSISGTVSSNQSLTKVTAGVYDLNDVQKTGKSASPCTTSYNIKGLDNGVYFNHLSAGVYRYKVIASTASKTETLVSKVFIILGNKQTIANGTYNFCSKGNTNLGLSISDNSHASGANVLLWENTASNNYMKWQVKYVSDGYYEIKNVATGLALDVKSAADANNANVHQYAANASIAQLWNFVPMGSYYCLVPKCARGRCLDVSEAKFNNGTNIQLWEANLNNAQLWKFSSTSKYTNKTVSIASTQVTGLGNKVWTGKKLVPSLGVTVAGTKLVKGTHYKVSCTNNVNVGTAKITIKGKGKYTGSLTKSFKIIPRTTSVTVSKGKKRFIARWKLRIPQTSGYQLQYSTNRSFKSFYKNITISNNLILSKNVINLKSKTNYYVRIRTYKVVGSKKYYSNWSKTVTVKPT